ncbi:MAG: iron chelate uptake ABC transporter family permease subunit [Pseudomonadota bacterium]
MRSGWAGWRGFQWRAYVAAVPRIAALADLGDVDAATFSREAAIAAQPDVAILAVWQIPLLMKLLALLVGAARAIAGTAMQTILGNCLASPIPSASRPLPGLAPR